MKQLFSALCGGVLLLIGATIGILLVKERDDYEWGILEYLRQTFFTDDFGGPMYEKFTKSEVFPWVMIGLLILLTLVFIVGGVWLLRRAFGMSLRAMVMRSLFLVPFTMIHAWMSFWFFAMNMDGGPMHPTLLSHASQIAAIVFLCPLVLPILCFAQRWLDGFAGLFWLIANSGIWAVAVLYGFGAARRFIQRRRERAL